MFYRRTVGLSILVWVLTASFSNLSATDSSPAKPPSGLNPLPVSTALNDPVRTISSLRLENCSSNSDIRVHVQGTLLDERLGEYVVIRDETGTLFAETQTAPLPPVEDKVDLWGTLVKEGTVSRLKNAELRSLNSPTEPHGIAPQEPRPATLPILTNIWQIRDLAAERAAWNYPVRLHAVVTVSIPASRFFFAQDTTAGISIQFPSNPCPLKPGDLVEIDGKTDLGRFAPIVRSSNITQVGSAPLPIARQETLFQLATGQDGSQWIEVHGVVHSTSFTNGLTTLHLSDQSGMLIVTVPTTNNPTYLLDAIVRIRGACGSSADQKRNFLGARMYVSSLDFIHVEEPGVADPLSLPAQPLASLNRFRPRQTLQHRMAFAGVVTLCEADQCFFIQDKDAGVQVLTPPTPGLRAGDYVLVAGYPALGDFGPVLRHAVVWTADHVKLPPPETICTAQNLIPRLQNRLVRIKARYLNWTRMDTVEVLTVQANDRIFEAHCLGPLPDPIKKLQPGSLLELTGIYHILADQDRSPISFQITIPSDIEIVVLESPSWWTLRHTATLLGLMGAIIAATTLWGVMLRRKVSEQTASIKETGDKFRTLVEQSLVGVGIIQDGLLVYTNPRLAEMFGYTIEEMSLFPLRKGIIEEDIPLAIDQVSRRLSGIIDLNHYPFRGLRKDGSIIHLEVLGSRTLFKGKPAVIATALDVTERKRTEGALAEASTLFQTLLDNTPDFIYLKDTQSRFVRMSKSFERAFNVSSISLILGKTDFDFFKEEHARIAFADEQEILRSGKPIIGKREKCLHIDNRVLWSLSTKMPWRDQSGTIIGTFGISKDVTANIEAEAELEIAHQRLIETSRLAGMAEVATDILHNVGNVVNSINVSCSLTMDKIRSSRMPNLAKLSALIGDNRKNLAEFLTTDPQGQQIPDYLANLSKHLSGEQTALLEELQHLLKHIDHIKQIVAMQQGFARVSGHRESVSVPQLIEDAITLNSPSNPQHKIKVSRELEGTSVLLTERHKVLQILVNLIRNANDSLEQSHPPEPLIQIRTSMEGGDRIKIQVIDNGIGIPAENLTRIFAHGFSTRRNGHGFGLHSSALAVRELGGTLEAHSSGPGQGATFTLVLPCAEGSS